MDALELIIAEIENDINNILDSSSPSYFLTNSLIKEARLGSLEALYKLASFYSDGIFGGAKRENTIGVMRYLLELGYEPALEWLNNNLNN